MTAMAQLSEPNMAHLSILPDNQLLQGLLQPKEAHIMAVICLCRLRHALPQCTPCLQDLQVQPCISQLTSRHRSLSTT